MISIFGNGPSTNHGCEAIVRGIDALSPEDMTYQIISINEEVDTKYGLSGLRSVQSMYPAKTNSRMSPEFFLSWLKMKFAGDYLDLDISYYRESIREMERKSDIVFSVGGDNYCYSGNEFYSRLNSRFHKEGLRTVLFGVSVEPDLLLNSDIQKDMKLYDHIMTRESLTYEAIRPYNSHSYLAPDPAFYMELPKESAYPALPKGEYVGLNVSPLILKHEHSEGIVLKNVINLIEYVLNSTNYSVLLIPHVVIEGNDDRTVLRTIKEQFENDDRVVLIEDRNAQELKLVISQCKMFIGARTHATIAAYSTFIPTLVIGYSVKARGLAKDIFGDWNQYVLPVQEVQKEDQLIEYFDWLNRNQDEIRRHLEQFIPIYKQDGLKVYSEFWKALK